jgi:glycosyltransferase involved in cell wall biosynthesis
MKNPKKVASKLPKFHIVVPSFNQGQFIGQTLDSILDQPGFDINVYVFDGGSTDGTVDLLKTFGKKIFWVSAKDEGQTDAINKGLRKILSSGDIDLENDIFAYINSDDYYFKYVFAAVALEFQNNPDENWLVGECAIVNADGNPFQKRVQDYKKFWRRFLSWNLLLILNPIPQPATFIRLKAVKATGEFSQNLRYTMDYEYWLRLWKKFGAPMQVDQVLSAFRIHGQSKGTTSFDKQFAEQLVVAKNMSQNPVSLILQKVHNKLITTVYKFLK